VVEWVNRERGRAMIRLAVRSRKRVVFDHDDLEAG
jgi:hypothetical protein